MKRILSIVAVLFIAISFGQDKPKDWTLLQEFEGVNIYYKYIECDYNRGIDQEFTVLKMENSTAEKISLNYWVELFYNNACKTCGEEEYLFHVDLEAGAFVEANCTLETNHHLRFFSKFIDFENVDQLTSFKLTKLFFGPNPRTCKTKTK